MEAGAADQGSTSVAFYDYWGRDQPKLKEIGEDLYAQFGTLPNATGLEYLQRLRIELEKEKGNLSKVTSRVMERVCGDGDAWIRDIYGSRWTQAAHFVQMQVDYTTFAFSQ